MKVLTSDGQVRTLEEAFALSITVVGEVNENPLTMSEWLEAIPVKLENNYVGTYLKLHNEAWYAIPKPPEVMFQELRVPMINNMSPLDEFKLTKFKPLLAPKLEPNFWDRQLEGDKNNE